MTFHPQRLPVAWAMIGAFGMGLMAATPARANDTGALVGGLIAGALVGGAVAAAANEHHHHNYYYYGGPAPAYYPPPPRPVYAAPVYGPGYCGAPPYPPCRTPVPY